MRGEATRMSPVNLLVVLPLLLHTLAVSGASAASVAGRYSLSQHTSPGQPRNGLQHGGSENINPNNVKTFIIQESPTHGIKTDGSKSQLPLTRPRENTEMSAQPLSSVTDDNGTDLIPFETSKITKMKSLNFLDDAAIQEFNAARRIDSIVAVQGNDVEDERAQPSLSNSHHHCHVVLSHDLTYRNCDIDQVKKTADCSGRNLIKVPQNLPSWLITLVLSHNCIHGSELMLSPFKRYPNLRSLVMDGNVITNLPDHSFQGLSQLTDLILSNNSIRMDQKLNQSKAFTPLTSLKTLIFNMNNKYPTLSGLAYPDMALSYLTSLEELHIDGLLNKIFGYHFKKMKKLRTLQMSGYKTGYCNLTYLSNATFTNVPNITLLNISDCRVQKDTAEIAVLEPLIKLETLDVSYNFYLGLEGMGNLMYGQRYNRNLKILKMNIIVERYGPCVVLYRNTLRYFVNTKLEIIEAFHNNIEMIEYGALSLLPTTLKTVYLKRNKIMFGSYWLNLNEMIQLQTLSLDGYDDAYKLPVYIPPKHIHCGHNSRSLEREDNSRYLAINEDDDPFLKLNLPPNLEYMSVESYSLSYEIDKLEFGPINKLKELSLRKNYFPKLTGPVYGLNDLKSLDLSFCSVNVIAPNFFSYFKSIKTLNLYGNALGDSLSKDTKGGAFASSSLEELNLGRNNIYALKKGVFMGCSNLKTLNLTDNRLHDISISPENLPELTTLDLSKNQMSVLPQALWDHFADMTSSGKKVTIDLTFNPIACDCESVPFLKWATKNKVFGDNHRHYFCYDPSRRSYRPIESYDDELKLLMSQCADNVPLFICVISATVVFFLALIGVVVYRFRWKMRYWSYIAKAMVGDRAKTDTRVEYKYDVFVSYCQQDRSFVEEELNSELKTERSVKLMLHDQCFQAGDGIGDSIVKAVQQCRKTLVVISRAMMDSQWCSHGIEMALQEASTTGRNVLVILLLEKIPPSSMSFDIVQHIRSNVYVSYPSNPEEREEFWEKLASDLKAS